MTRVGKTFRRHPLASALAVAGLVYVAIAAQFFVTAPPLEAEDGFQQYAYVRWLLSQHSLPLVGQELGTIAPRQEAAQPPLYYALAAAVETPVNVGDFDRVAILNPAGGAKLAGPNQNAVLHRPFSWPPHGAELGMRLVELLSMACGLVAVGSAVVLARQYVPARPVLWMTSGLAVAADSAFDYHAGQINNDNLVIALSSVTIVLLALWLRKASPKCAWLSAFSLGLAVLAKFNAIGLAACYVLVALLVHKSARRRWLALVPLAVCLVVLDGWWMVRGALLYGDPTSMYVLAHAYNPKYQPFGLDNLRLTPAALAFSFHSFFSMYGISQNIDALPAFWVSALIGTIGLLVGAVALVRDWRKPLALLLLSWPVVVGLQVLGYAYSEGGGGRFAFPAMSSLGLMAVLGWAKILRGRTLPAIALTAISLAVPPLVAWRTIAPVFAYPPTMTQLPAGARPVQATFGGTIELVGVRSVPSPWVEPGHPADLTLYWRATAPVDALLNTFVHLDSNDPGYSSGANYDGPSGAGTYPPSFWPVGRIVSDHYRLTVNADGRSDRRNSVALQLRTGMYPVPRPGQPIRKLRTDPPQAADVGFPVALWKIAGSPPAPPPSPLARFSNGFELLSASAQPDGASSIAVALDWRASAIPSANFTIFEQVLAADGPLVAQHDAAPLEARYPTSLWSAGEQVFDSVQLRLPRPRQAGDSVIVGMYALPGAQRVPTEQGESFVRLALAP